MQKQSPAKQAKARSAARLWVLFYKYKKGVEATREKTNLSTIKWLQRNTL